MNMGATLNTPESRNTEESLKKSEFRFRTLFNSASDAIFTMKNRMFIDCNEATLRIFQCTRDQIIGHTPWRFSPSHQPDGKLTEESGAEKIAAVLSGRPQFFEWQHIRYNGVPFDAEVSLNRLDLDDGVYIQAIVRDISERKKAEAENKRLAMVANTTTNMVILANGSGRIEWVNPAFTKITGYALQEVVAKAPGSFLSGEDTDKKVSHMMGEKIKQGLGFKNVEIINYTKSKKPYWVSIEVQPIHDKNGLVTQFIAIETDITERKATQKALMDRNEELIKINTELDRFVYSASHDLRAPISSLLGLIEIARLETDPETIKELLEMQRKSLVRMDRFINDIVDHSRNTRLSIEPEPVDFEYIVDSTFEQLQFMDNENRISKIISIQQDYQFYSSCTRIEIIFNNLISNAIKYADLMKPDPFLEIKVSVNQEIATLRIRDNGEGIPVDAQSKIFNMFFRASGTGTGSGLGLYIVKEAIEKLKGTISLKSEYGFGTEFIVELPNIPHQ